jgi:hypothetical protein
MIRKQFLTTELNTHERKFDREILRCLFAMKNDGLIFIPFFIFGPIVFFLGWKDLASENFGEKITSTKISFGKKLFPNPNMWKEKI